MTETGTEDMAEGRPTTRRKLGAEDIQHELAQLKVVDIVRNLAFPVAAVGAGISVLSGISLFFPLLAAVGAGFTLYGRRYAKKKNRELNAAINSVEANIPAEKVHELKAILNRLTAEGPSI